MRIAVLMGGASEEREVSLSTGVQVARALRRAGHEVAAVDTAGGPLSAAEEEERLSSGVRPLPPDLEALRHRRAEDATAVLRLPEVAEADLLFVALHGGAGEDGTFQALLDLVDLPYTGSGPLGCALAMDKEISKRLFRDAGIPTAEWRMAPAPGEEMSDLDYPVVVKPNNGGSTLGLTVVREARELEDAIGRARRFDPEVMVERFVTGRELTVGIVGGDALPAGEIIPEHEIFDYECKYQPGLAREIFPADLPDAIAGSLRRLSLRAHRVLKLGGYSRIDFLLDEEDVPWCLEANALPGMTSNSLLPKAAAAAGIGFAELCDRIVREVSPGTE